MAEGKGAKDTDDIIPIRPNFKRKIGSVDGNQIKPYGNKIKVNDRKATTEEVEKIRFENGIEVDTDNCPGPILGFEESNLQTEIIEVLKHRSILIPTPVQMQSLPIQLLGRDLIAIAPTGSGKTLGYLLPMFAFLKSNTAKITSRNNTSSLIVVPTRELMQQVLDTCESFLGDLNKGNISQERFVTHSHTQRQNQDQLNFISTYQNPVNQFSWNPPSQNTGSQYPNADYGTRQPFFHTTQTDLKNIDSATGYCVYGICGGVPMKPQIERLKSRVDVIVATPGRLLDLCQRNLLCLKSVRYIVLDECDKMLDMDLEDQLRKLMAMVMSNEMPQQTSLWSATLPSSLERLARSSVINPITINVGLKDTVCKNIEQNVIFMHTYQKEKKLLQTIRQTKYPPVLIFVSSITMADEIAQLLKEEEFFVERLHSQLNQNNRFKILSDFRNGELDVLVGTDLASRGLDIPDITHVINYDTPNSIEDYIHRCGRTGRFGRHGKATTFLTLECKIAEELKLLLESTGSTVPMALKDTKQFGKTVLKTELGDRLL
ncbi:uncharacterized protein LOC135686516 [Rhopilema esculentum]|uniref:uncharacterized protein LOC135686516 n=1 Tax=Rhopilema esculentum TaxID=499914 RepID=UPI0031CF7126|eukprot:gene727-10442_t